MIMFIDGHYNPDTVCIIALPALIKKLITGVVITHMRITWHKFVKKKETNISPPAFRLLNS
jgi:hypothetical protein